jgi:hypothetical protein
VEKKIFIEENIVCFRKSTVDLKDVMKKSNGVMDE